MELKRLGAIHVRNDIKRVFADGDEVCDTFAEHRPALLRHCYAWAP